MQTKNEFQKFMKARGLSFTQLAVECGIPQATLCRQLSKVTHPLTLMVLERLVKRYPIEEVKDLAKAFVVDFLEQRGLPFSEINGILGGVNIPESLATNIQTIYATHDSELIGALEQVVAILARHRS